MEVTARKRLRRRRLARVLFTGLGLILIVLAGIAGYALANSSLFDLREIRIEGNLAVPREELLVLSGLRLGTNLLRVSPAEAKAQLLTQPYIKEVEVRRRFPSEMSIKVVERAPMVLVSYDTQSLILDSEGICLENGNKAAAMAASWVQTPAIKSNFAAIQMKPGDKTEDEGILAAIALLKQLDAYFMENILEIDAASAWTLSVINLDGLTVYFGPPENLAQKLQNYEDLLIKNREECNADTLEYVDLRYDTQPIIKRK